MLQQEPARRKSLCNWAEVKSVRTPRGNAPKLATIRASVVALPALVAAGHGLAAIAFCLGFDAAWVMQQISILGLPAPHTRPMRRTSGNNPWTSEQVQRLILLWPTNLYATSISQILGRSPSSVRYKAKWLGLPVRDRSTLVRSLPDTPPSPRHSAYAHWPKQRDAMLGERVLRGQHFVGIAAEMGGTPSGIASRAYNIGLPGRHGLEDLLRMDVDLKLPRLKKFVDEGWGHRPCNANPEKWFWSARSGDRTAPSTKKSKSYRDRLASGGNSAAADVGEF